MNEIKNTLFENLPAANSVSNFLFRLRKFSELASATLIYKSHNSIKNREFDYRVHLVESFARQTESPGIVQIKLNRSIFFVQSDLL